MLSFYLLDVDPASMHRCNTLQHTTVVFGRYVPPMTFQRGSSLLGPMVIRHFEEIGTSSNGQDWLWNKQDLEMSLVLWTVVEGKSKDVTTATQAYVLQVGIFPRELH